MTRFRILGVRSSLGLRLSFIACAALLGAGCTARPKAPAVTEADTASPGAIQARVVPEPDPLMEGVDAELLGDVSGIKHATLPGVQTEGAKDIESETDADDAEIQKAMSAKARGSAKAKLAAIELLWRVPNQSVEHYVLSYGSSPEQLFHRVIIPLSKLESIAHPSYGSVYRYILHRVPTQSALYFTLQAGNSTGLSDEAPVQHIEIQ